MWFKRGENQYFKFRVGEKKGGQAKKDKTQFITLKLWGYMSIMSSVAVLTPTHTAKEEDLWPRRGILYKTKTNTVHCHCYQVLLNGDCFQQELQVSSDQGTPNQNYSSYNSLFVKLVSTACEYLIVHEIGQNLQICHLLKMSPVSKIQLYEKSGAESSSPPTAAPPPLY